MSLRALALAFVLAAACSDDAPPGRYRATGTIVHDGLAGDDEAGWRSEMDILRSRAFIDFAVVLMERDGRLPADLADHVERGLRVTRRRDARAIEVQVGLDDRDLAQRACNALVEAYVMHALDAGRRKPTADRERLTARLESLRHRLAIPNDAGVENPALAREYDETLAGLQALAVERDVAPRAARVLDRCLVR